MMLTSINVCKKATWIYDNTTGWRNKNEQKQPKESSKPPDDET